MVLNLEEIPDSYEINFPAISAPYTITPNRYDAFTLTCTVNTVKSDAVSVGDSYFGYGDFHELQLRKLIKKAVKLSGHPKPPPTSAGVHWMVQGRKECGDWGPDQD